jgi:O-antigen ligase
MFRFHRVLIAYAVAIPLALILGYLIATPDMASITVVGMVLFFLALPLLIQWNHGLLIFFWNSAFIAGFLPGQLQLWTIFAALTFGMGMVHLVMGHGRFLRAPELTKPILFLAAVVVLTAKIRGGVGMRILGSDSFGGKYYFYVMAAIIGYFALASQPISVTKSARAVNWFFLSGLSQGLTNLAYTLGPAFYFVYYFVSTDFAAGQAAADWQQDLVKRFGGLGPCATSLLCYCLARWGIRGLFEWNKPWRLLLFIAALTTGLFSGFRSEMGILGILLVVQFVVEGLWKTAFLPALVLLGFLCLTPMLLFAAKMPAAVQRALAFLPVDIDPQVRQETIASSEWRFEMWREVWPEVPKYLLIGKGYAINPVDMYLTEEGVRLGMYNTYETSIVAGDYHNGALSVLMPFGALGAIAFLWTLGAGIKVLCSNRRNGDPRLKRINNLLLSFFLTQSVCFFLVFGAFNSQLSVFLGILGLSVSLNGGVCRKKAVKAVEEPASAAAVLEPA